jgi:hypothetical protein
LNKIREFIKSVSVFRVRDIEIIVENRSCAHLILHKLEKRRNKESYKGLV